MTNTTPLNKQFIKELQLDGCNVLAGSYNYVDAILTEDSVDSYLEGKDNINTFFLTGANPERGLERVYDIDILKKNHIFFDFDIKKDYPVITLEELRGLAQVFADSFKDSPYGDWRYITFTGGGLHVHYISQEVIVPTNNRVFAAGYKKYMKDIEALTGFKADPACSNLARLVRLPGSWNVKQETIDAWGKQQVEIMLFQDKWFSLDEIEAVGATEIEKQSAIAKAKAAERLENFSFTEHSTFDAINSLPIAALLANEKAWETDGRNFWEASGVKKYKACFVPDGENFVVHGGTHHLGNLEGYSCFTLIKELYDMDNQATFEWFKEAYPAINDISQKEFKEKLEEAKEEKKLEEVRAIVPLGNIASVAERLKTFNFEFLNTGLKYADDNKWLIRGAVTRIGAASSVGKSAFAYWLSHHLLKQGHKGVIISSEVQSPLVLAHMLKIKNKWDFWDILEHKHVPSAEDLEAYSKMWVFDTTNTKNLMETIKPMLKEIKPDFVVIDFLQGITPTDAGGGNYEKLTNYAFEVQQMAQELESSVIDLSQISNADIKTANMKTNPIDRLNLINFKGSGDLYSSADVCLMLDRNKTADIDDEFGPDHFGIRMAKHKYMDTGYHFLKSNFETGHFTSTNKAAEDIDWDSITNSK